MKRYLYLLLLVVLALTSAYFVYRYSALLNITPTSNESKLAITSFLLGLSIAVLFAEPFINKVTTDLTVYKRELEKESIDSSERSSKVKVLESKIQVLEKALEEALNK